MREALKMGKALYEECMTPEVFSWDDASDNRFLASGVASWIHDAISAFHSTRITNHKVFEQTFVVQEVAGPGGRWNVGAPHVRAVWKLPKDIARPEEASQDVADDRTQATDARRG